MPVSVHAETRRLTQEQFAEVAYEVMGHVFQIHSELGRFFREEIYHNEIARRCGGLARVPIEVWHGGFRKFYYPDLLVGQGAVFELKTVRNLNERHRGQLLQYLLLADLAHGKLVNIRSELVEHEFVNTMLTTSKRTSFTVDASGWDASEPGALEVQDTAVALLRDLGTGLGVGLYDEALTHLLGGENSVLQRVEVHRDGRPIGSQTARLVAPAIAFKTTAIPEHNLQRMEDHLRRFLNHTRLTTILWINVRPEIVTFKTLHSESA